MLSGESKSRKDAVWKVLDDDRPGNDPRYANKFPIRAAARFPSSFVPRPFDERASERDSHPLPSLFVSVLPSRPPISFVFVAATRTF